MEIHEFFEESGVFGECDVGCWLLMLMLSGSDEMGYL